MYVLHYIHVCMYVFIPDLDKHLLLLIRTDTYMNKESRHVFYIRNSKVAQTHTYIHTYISFQVSLQNIKRILMEGGRLNQF